MANVLHGQWGYYYPYTDESGKSKGLKIFDWIYDKYYEPGYLTDDLIDAMLAGKTVTFDVPSKGTITAKIVPYTNKRGIPTRIIQFDEPDEGDKLPDDQIILANSEKITTSYWDNAAQRFNYSKPQIEIDALGLTKRWKTYARDYWLSEQYSYGDIKVYKTKARKDDHIQLWCIVDKSKNECKESSEEEIKALKDRLEKELEERTTKRNAIRKIGTDWLNSVQEIIWPGGSSIDMSAFIKNVEPLISDIDISDVNELIKGLLTSKSIPSLNTYFTDASHEIHRLTHESTIEDVEKIKDKLLKQLKIRYEYEKVKEIRRSLLSRIDDEGLPSVVADVDVDLALDLGIFREVQKILKKYGDSSVKYICMNMYPEIIDKVDLETRLLNLLKVYYDFYDMPEKDRKSIAKFIAKHKLSDYYERISRYDDVLETLIDESKDPKLLKPILNDIAGTSRASCLKDKTYYFEKRGRLRRDVILYKPIELVEELRKYIKEFNVSSDVAILTNIELDADASFVFCFYTFAKTDGDTSGFDGRRMLNLTKIYNRNHKKEEKIGFIFNNEDDDADIEDDE